MDEQAQTSIVRIYRRQDNRLLPIGCGFLIGGKSILTCWHVAREALFPKIDLIGQEVELDFPFPFNSGVLRARVVFLAEEPDLIKLELLSDPPETTNPMPLSTETNLWHHPYSAFGITSERPEGCMVDGKIKNRIGDGTLQIESKSAYKVEKGFSGTAVWDDQLKTCVGMVVLTESDKETKAAYAIPVTEILKKCPELKPLITVTEPAKNSPPSVTDKIKSEKLISFLSSCTKTELTSSILFSHCDLDYLDLIILESPDQASKILVSIARNHPDDEWLIQLCLYICSKLKNPSKNIVPLVFSIAFDSSYSASARHMAISWLRFCDADLFGNQLFKIEEETNDINTTRLVLEAFGFIGSIHDISWLIDKHHILEDSYENFKLGSSAVLACLDCYVYHGKKYVYDRYSIDKMKEVILAMNKLADEGHFDSDLGFQEYFYHLQNISRGLAINLLHHLLKDNYSDTLLRALLSTFQDKQAYLILEDLKLIVLNPKNEDIFRDAFITMAYMKSEKTATVLEQYMNDGYPGAREAFVLTIGINKERRFLDFLIKELSGSNLNERTLNYAVWSIGELARDDPMLAERHLLGWTKVSDNKYSINKYLIGICRGLAWLGLAKAGLNINEEDFRIAFDSSTYFVEELLISIAASIAGYQTYFEKGLHATQHNSSPIWQLESYLFNEVKFVMQNKTGIGGRNLLKLMAV